MKPQLQQNIKKFSNAICSFSQVPPYNASDNVLYYVMTATAHTACPLSDSIISKEWRRFTTAAGHNQVTQPLISLWWKDRGSPNCESQLIISHVPQVINSGESGENGNSELIKDSVLQRFWHFRRFLPIWSWEGTWWVSLIPSRRTDNLYRGGWVRSKLMWTPHTGGQLKLSMLAAGQVLVHELYAWCEHVCC